MRQDSVVPKSSAEKAQQIMLRLAVNRVKGRIEQAVRDEIFDYLVGHEEDARSRQVNSLGLELLDGLSGSTSRRRNRDLKAGMRPMWMATVAIAVLVWLVSPIRYFPQLYTLLGPGHWASILISYFVITMSLLLLIPSALTLGYAIPPIKAWVYRVILLIGSVPQLVVCTRLNGPWALVVTLSVALIIGYLVFLEAIIASLGRDLKRQAEQTRPQR